MLHIPEIGTGRHTHIDSDASLVISPDSLYGVLKKKHSSFTGIFLNRTKHLRRRGQYKIEGEGLF